MKNRKKKNSTITATVVTLFLVLNYAQTILAVDCPRCCKCSWVLDSLEVDCSRRDLIEYPVIDNLPVEHLDLSSNKFSHFPSHLASIESLIYLDLSNNQIQLLESDALLGFTAMRTLILANNSIKGWRDLNPNNAFRNAINLKQLSLSGNPLRSFANEDKSILLMSQSLTMLDVSYCDIKSATGNFILSGMPLLERLKLTGNPLNALTTLQSHSLRILEVSNGSLTRINTFFMDGLSNLEAIDLSWNAGIMLGTSATDVIECESLNEIDVSFCAIDSIDLSGFPNLSVVRLRGNMLRSITTKMFANNSQIEILDLSRNSIRHIDDDAFNTLRRLTKLDLSYNEIIRIDRNSFRNNNALVTLNLSRNFINKFTKFSSNTLRDINLSWCEILTIDSSVFSGLATLTKLDLSNNLIKDFPGGMRSETLQRLDLSNCRLTAIKNNTFLGFPELASLWLVGNRFTDPFPSEYFRSNKFLDEIWLGDNPWRCDCQATTFVEFYDFLNRKPKKLKDKNNARCASPPQYYGRAWETACLSSWIPQNRSSGTTIMLTLTTLISILLCVICFRKIFECVRKRRNRQEYRQNHEELMEIRHQNERILDQQAQPNAPNPFETNLPSYEDALLMPKLERSAKSMVNLSSARSRRKGLQLKTGAEFENDCSNTNSNGVDDDYDSELVIDHRRRFRSEEIISNRDKERRAPIGTFRRTGRVEQNNSGSRQLRIDDSRFPPAHLKSQNLHSAEQFANFQSYENSPYSKRKAKLPDIPPFQRVTYERDSVEFLTDSECNSKPASPFTRRLPKGSTHSILSICSEKRLHPDDEDGLVFTFGSAARLDPAVDDYFGAQQSYSRSRSINSSSSEFQVLQQPAEADISSLSDCESEVELGRIEKNRILDGLVSVSSEQLVIVHKPMRESTL